jgi:Uri superfamily endonuclease
VIYREDASGDDPIGAGEMTVHLQVEQPHSLYAVKGFLEEDRKDLAIGKLGVFSFRKGLYVYVGSARKNLQSRIARHLQMEKKLRWHFDYLRPYLKIVEVETFPGEEGECRLFQRLMTELGGIAPVRGFGSSDCGCAAHLFFVPDR